MILTGDDVDTNRGRGRVVAVMTLQEVVKAADAGQAKFLVQSLRQRLSPEELKRWQRVLVHLRNNKKQWFDSHTIKVVERPKGGTVGPKRTQAKGRSQVGETQGKQAGSKT